MAKVEFSSRVLVEEYNKRRKSGGQIHRCDENKEIEDAISFQSKVYSPKIIVSLFFFFFIELYYTVFHVIDKLKP